MSIVYTCFTTDIIHEGHLNIINESKKLGDLVVGVLDDSALIKYNYFPLKSLEERKKMIEKIDGVKEVIVQKDIMYDEIISRLHPDYVVHGDNWKNGPMQVIRKNVEKLLNEYGGKIIDLPYTLNENTIRDEKRLREKLAMPEYRRERLRKLMDICPIVKTIEVHSGLTGLIAEKKQ